MAHHTAAYVFDVELFARALRKLLRNQTSDHVGWTAGRVGDDHAHRSVGIALRNSGMRCRGENGSRHCQMQKSTALKFHLASLSCRWSRETEVGA